MAGRGLWASSWSDPALLLQPGWEVWLRYGQCVSTRQEGLHFIDPYVDLVAMLAMNATLLTVDLRTRLLNPTPFPSKDLHVRR